MIRSSTQDLGASVLKDYRHTKLEPVVTILLGNLPMYGTAVFNEDCPLVFGSGLGTVQA